MTTAQLQWPEITQENKPWSRWWWMGNILPENELTLALDEYKKAGLGGLEITPIYGVKGFENQFVNFLSPEYMDKLIFVLKEAKAKGLGIDMATGTGWPFGGPWVTPEDACKYITHKIYYLRMGETLSEAVEFIQKPLIRTVSRRVEISELKDPITANNNLQSLAIDQVRFPKPIPLQALMAYADNGTILNLTEKVEADGKLNWTAPEGNWTLYALFQGWHGKMVERAGPGGEGDVIDHFSKKALDNYLKKFDDAFTGRDISSLRAFFNDSYEVDDAMGEANWTPSFVAEFANRRGYDLLNHLPALFGMDTINDKHIRVLCDYRQTISELLLEKFTAPWHDWAQGKGAVIRNQAHGSPANILDLYAAIDIPECEGNDVLRFKFASSASNVTGKPLTSSEAATWLNEHFVSSLGDVKQNLDKFMLGGVNHNFYHGTTFSPKAEPWPGWMFYASVHFGVTNTWWKDFAKLNRYVARCQSFLQDGKPDNDVLLYFNFYDRISEPGKAMLQHFEGGGHGTTARDAGDILLKKGYAFDFISDKQLEAVQFADNSLRTGGVAYQTVVLPDCKYIPAKTFEKLIDLAKAGATIIIHKNLPEDTQGYANLEARQKMFRELKLLLSFEATDNTGIKQARIGLGSFMLGDDLDRLLTFAGIRREKMMDQELQSVRRSHENGNYFFIVNRGEEPVNGWIPLSVSAKSVGIFNPMNEKAGKAALKVSEADEVQVYLQLSPGESCILKTFDYEIKENQYEYIASSGDPQNISGKWSITFIEGGPELPNAFQTATLNSWTEFDGQEVKRFSGTAKYTISFSKPKTKCEGWYLDLGRVAESARVKINGKDYGTFISIPFRVYIPAEKLLRKNTLEVEVTNLMVNRMAYMDREGIQYKKFYNINFPSRLSENRGNDGLFTAAKWEPKESGLIGSVTLTPVNKLIIQ